MTQPTIRDVAKKAGVGIGTVSRVLNNSPQVSPQTRERVLGVIEALGFRPNRLARQLPRKTRVHNIGVITLPFRNYHSFVERLRGVQSVLGDSREVYELVLYNVSTPHRYAERLSAIANAAMLEGLLIIDLDLTDEQEALLRQAGIPFVGLNNYWGRSWPCIGTSNVEGSTLATTHLLELGHRAIAYIGDEFPDEYGFASSAERYEGYEQALQEYGLSIDPDFVLLGPHGYDSAKAMTAQLLQMSPRPTAIVAMSDIQALGCIAAAQEAGLNVPRDVSIAGYDDLEISAHTGLTTVRQHLEASGRAGMDYLMRLMSTAESGPPPALPAPELIARQTTAAFSASGTQI